MRVTIFSTGGKSACFDFYIHALTRSSRLFICSLDPNDRITPMTDCSLICKRVLLYIIPSQVLFHLLKYIYTGTLMALIAYTFGFS